MQHLELAHDAYQAHRGLGRPDIGAFQFSLLDFNVQVRRGRRRRIDGMKIAAALFGERTRIGETHDRELTQRLALLSHNTVGRNIERRRRRGL